MFQISLISLNKINLTLPSSRVNLSMLWRITYRNCYSVGYQLFGTYANLSSASFASTLTLFLLFFVAPFDSDSSRLTAFFTVYFRVSASQISSCIYFGCYSAYHTVFFCVLTYGFRWENPTSPLLLFIYIVRHFVESFLHILSGLRAYFEVSHLVQLDQLVDLFLCHLSPQLYTWWPAALVNLYQVKFRSTEYFYNFFRSMLCQIFQPELY